jgi:hypothetical protein
MCRIAVEASPGRLASAPDSQPWSKWLISWTGPEEGTRDRLSCPDHRTKGRRQDRNLLTRVFEPKIPNVGTDIE